MLRPKQHVIFKSAQQYRYVVAVCGRRFGKSILAIYMMAYIGSQPNKKIYYISPTYRQSKEILWEQLKSLFYSHNWIKDKNEVDLSIILKSGSKISLRGADKPDSLRGVGLDYVIFDEFADQKAEIWTSVIRPTLSDTGGKAIFLGTPKGKQNLLYDFYQRGQNPDEIDWASFQFTTLDGKNVPAEEIESARRELDEKTFKQEYLGTFEDFESLCYYNFTDANKIQCKQFYNPNDDLIFCYDFNVAPGISAIAIETDIGTCLIGEVHIKRNSTTPAVCDKLIQDWGNHQGHIYCYGDATGGAKGSAKVAGSDWDLIKQKLYGHFGSERVHFRVDKANPREKIRINAMTSRIQTFDGKRHLFVDYSCKNIIKDFEGVQTLAGGSGEIDKKSTPELTHLTDSIGYYINKRFPVVSRKTKVRELMI